MNSLVALEILGLFLRSPVAATGGTVLTLSRLSRQDQDNRRTVQIILASWKAVIQ